ncbi:MAG: hypothetical protein ACM3WV_00285 [Bacillota bacterium]
MLKRILFVAAVSVILCAGSQAAPDKGNMVINPSFEEVAGDKPAGWNVYIAYKEPPPVVKAEKGRGRTGQYCAAFHNPSANDTRFVQSIPVEANSFYKLSCWVKTENVGMEAKGANISIGCQLEISEDIKGTSGDWKNIEMYLRVGKGISAVDLTVGLGGYSSCNTGKAYIDDVKMEKVKQIPPGVRVANMGQEEHGIQSGGQNDGSKAVSWAGKFIFWSVVVVCIISGVILAKSRKNGQDVPEEANKG